MGRRSRREGQAVVVVPGRVRGLLVRFGRVHRPCSCPAFDLLPAVLLNPQPHGFVQGALCFNFLPCVWVYIVFALPGSVTRQRCDRWAVRVDIVVRVFAFDDGQYMRQIELIFGKQVVEFAFKFEFADKARVDFDEGEFRLFRGEQSLEGAEFGEAGHGSSPSGDGVSNSAR